MLTSADLSGKDVTYSARFLLNINQKSQRFICETNCKVKITLYGYFFEKLNSTAYFMERNDNK